MITTAGDAGAVAVGARETPRLVRTFLSAWVDTWWLTVVGGGACGLVCGGFISVVFLFWTLPVGMYLGAGLGLPLGLVIAIAMTTRAARRTEPGVLARHLQWVGIGIAVTVVGTINIYATGVVTFADDGAFGALGIAALACNGALAVGVAAAIGRECGYRLATRHLHRFGHTPPRRLPIYGRFRRRPAANNGTRTLTRSSGSAS
jgi:hypothetical protein